MRTLGGIMLALIALFCGGCSIFFGLNDLGGSGLGVAVIWVPGLLIAALAGWGAVTLLSSGKARSGPTDLATQPARPDLPPKSDHW